MCFLNPFPTMATNTPNPLPAAPPATQTRPLRREGAIILLSRGEQALEDAMLWSDSPEPEASTLGKRNRANDSEDHDGTDTEPDLEAPTTTSQTLVPTSSNITAASLRYATQKRLRSEQRGELDAFLLASTSCLCSFTRTSRLYHCSGLGAGSTSKDICMPSLYWEQDRGIPIRCATLSGLWRVKSMSLDDLDDSDVTAHLYCSD